MYNVDTGYRFSGAPFVRLDCYYYYHFKTDLNSHWNRNAHNSHRKRVRTQHKRIQMVCGCINSAIHTTVHICTRNIFWLCKYLHFSIFLPLSLVCFETFPWFFFVFKYCCCNLSHYVWNLLDSKFEHWETLSKSWLSNIGLNVTTLDIEYDKHYSISISHDSLNYISHSIP